MKRLLLIVLPLLLIVGCSKPVEDSTLINKDGLMYLPDSDTPYSGEVFTNYSTGEKEYQGTYENGLLVQYSYLNKDGTVKEPINGETLTDRGGLLYEVNGQKPYTGDVFELHKDGSRKYTGSLKGGKKDKLWTYWYENGQKWKENTYKDGKQDGLWTEWYENGQKWNEGTYSDGEIDGLFTEWYENGQKKSEGTLKDGLKQEGKWTYWYENGEKESERTFKDGKEEGKWTYWYDTGEIKREGIFKEGKEIGIWTSWVITDNEFGCFIGLKIKSDDILNYKVLKTIEKISNTLNPNESLFSIINESFYQSNEGFLEIKQMFNDSSSLKLSEIEKQQIIKHTQQRESIRNVLLSLDNSYTTVLINTNTISPDKIERIEETVERYETDDIDIDIYVPSIIQVEGDIKSPSVLQSIEKIKQFLKNNYDVEYSLSLSDHIKDLYSTVLDYDPDFKVIPESRDKINNLLTLYSMSGDPDDFSHLVDYDYTKTNILFYLPDKSELEKSKMVLELMKFIYELKLIEKFNIITYPIKYEYF
jgi:antitoxin component YwqK of YwqJK toxin-antitoxin module